MRGILLLLLSTTLLCQRVCSQGTTPAPRRLLLPPPPPPPPNSPPNFDRDGDKATVAPPPKPQDPIQELIDTGGVELIVDIEFSSFESKEEARFKTIMSDTSNDYCATKGNCEGDNTKTVTADDVIVYDIQSVKTKRTAVSFYIKNPQARTQLTMTSEQLQMMFKAKRTDLEDALGYRMDLGDIDGFVPFTNGLALDSWLIALLAVIGLMIIVFSVVCIINYRNKKTDTRMTFDDVEMQQAEPIKKVLPSGPVVPASSLKKAKVDATTNVYQSEILAETKSVIKPAKGTGQEEVKTTESSEPPASPNAIVVTADVSSSNEGSSDSDEEPTSPGSANNAPPPDYEQATLEETKVIEGPGSEVASASVVAAISEVPPSTAADEELPPPPMPAGESNSASSSSADLPPPTPPEQDKGPSTTEASSTRAEAQEVVDDKEKLIADKSKATEEDMGLDNAGFETVVGKDGTPSTEL